MDQRPQFHASTPIFRTLAWGLKGAGLLLMLVVLSSCRSPQFTQLTQLTQLSKLASATWPRSDDTLPSPQLVIDGEHASLIPAVEVPPASIGQLTPREAVRLALQHSRELKTLNDALVEQAYDALSAQRDFAWDSDIVASYDVDEDGDTTSNVRLDIRETLDTGGDILFRTNLEPESERGGGSTVGGVTFRINHPVLRGAGHTISHEAAIQAHRSLLYQLRSFETEREDLLIRVLDAYYDLVNQEAVLENVRRNLEQSRFLAERSEAVFEVQKASYLDVLRAQQQLLSAENQLANAEANVTTAKKSFLARLGLPIDQSFTLVPTPPPLLRLVAQESNVMEAGLMFRRRLRTTADRLEDAERGLKLARNNRLPDLSVFAETTALTEDDDIRDDGFSTGVSLSIPLQRGGVNDAIKVAEIRRMRAQRNLINTEASVRIELLERMNQLKNFERNVNTERQNVEIAEKRLEFATIRFEDGTLSNRDVVEAQTAELDARNAFVRALVNHEIERLRLLQSAGCLVVDADGSLLARQLGSGEWFSTEREASEPQETTL